MSNDMRPGKPGKGEPKPVLPERITPPTQSNQMHLHIYIHQDEPLSVTSKLDDILTRLGALKRQGVIDMATMTDIQQKLTTLQTDVESETNVTASVKTLLEGQNAMLVQLKEQLAAAIAANDPQALQAVADALDTITTTNARNKAETIAHVLANTPSEGETPIPVEPSEPPLEGRQRQR